MKQRQGLLVTVLFCLFILAGGLGLLLLPKRQYSEAERRALAELPALTPEAVFSGSFSERMDDWAADHFPFREGFRHLEALSQFRLLRVRENRGLVEADGSIMKLEKQVNEESVSYAVSRYQAICKNLLTGTDCKLYCAVIPDKSHYLPEPYPVMELDRMEALLQAGLPGARAISLTDTLCLEDYYRTDTHWRQERLFPAAARLLSDMGRDDNGLREADYSPRRFFPFLGVYAGQSALEPPPETITYLTGGPIRDCVVKDFETGRIIPMYDPEGCDPRDRYTLFLGGAKSLLRIENPAVDQPGELIVFRDSFGSAIAPLLCANYRTVTLVDLRYISPDVLPRYLHFSSQDVLFLCSATLLNQSQGLR